jgi:hypothetical protein
MAASHTSHALRLMVYDRTCIGRFGRMSGLSMAWAAGAVAYRAVGRLDASFGASTWREALAWLALYEPTQPIAEVQYWGHGRWGRVYIASDELALHSLGASDELAPALDALRARLLPAGQSLVWLRTCETFGARAGSAFAVSLSERLGARVAGHTFIIGALQSGLHGLLPGHAPDWPADEGLAEGTAEHPVRARGSSYGHPRTISCLDGSVPSAWFA